MNEMKEINFLAIGDDKDFYNALENIFKKSKNTSYSIYYCNDRDINILKTIRNKKINIILIDFSCSDEFILNFYKKYNLHFPIIGIYNESVSIINDSNINIYTYFSKNMFMNDFKNIEININNILNKWETDKKLYNDLKYKEAIINTPIVGFCLIDTDEDKIIEYNNAFLKVLNITEDDIRENKAGEFFRLDRYSKCVYKNNIEETCTFSSFFICKSFCEARITNNYGYSVDCLVYCEFVFLHNRENKCYKAVTLLDITKFKNVEKKLIKAQCDLQDVVKKYGLEEKKPEAFLSLVDLELEKLSCNEDWSKWETSYNS
jgi:hypothetical protein